MLSCPHPHPDVPEVRFRAIELHLHAETSLPKKFGARIKAVNGSYSEVRGHRDKRYVTVPGEARDLIAELMAAYSTGPKTTVILRNPFIHGGEFDGTYVRNADEVAYWLRGSIPDPRAFIDQLLTGTSVRRSLGDKLPGIVEQVRRDRAYQARMAQQRQLTALEEAIVAEAEAIAQGKNDIDDLKALALQRKALHAELHPAPRQPGQGEGPESAP